MFDGCTSSVFLIGLKMYPFDGTEKGIVEKLTKERFCELSNLGFDYYIHGVHATDRILVV